MITIPIQAKVTTSGTHHGPYTCTFESTNTCATFSENNISVVANSANEYIASTTITYTDENCISNSVITATFVNAKGCSETKVIPVSNPCNLTHSIAPNGEFQFVATTTGGSGSYTYQWVFDNTVFKSVDNNIEDSILYLQIAGLFVPSTTTVQCIVTDNVYKCTKQASYSYNFCKPSVYQTRVGLVCNSTPLTGCSIGAISSQYRNYVLSEAVRPCSGQVIDWSFLEMTEVPGVCIINNQDGTISIATNRTTAQVVNVLYRVKTTKGIVSDFGQLSITIPVCSATKKFSGTPMTIQLTADDSVSDVKTLPVESRVGGSADWSTFQFTNTPSWGTVTFNGSREIKYTITDLTTTPAVPDVIKWSLNDIYGNQINITDTVLRDVIAVPSTVTDSVCVTCGEYTTVDVLANDTGDIDRSTLTIVLNDPDIVITKDTDNNLVFTALTGASLSNLNSYKVANTQGAFSATQNFFVHAACVGDITTPYDLTCLPSKTFDLIDLFVGQNSFTQTYAETSTITPDYTTQGGTIVGALGTVNFTGINNGTYKFEFTAGNVAACAGTDDTGEVTIIHGATPNITFTTATDNGNGTSTYTFTYSGIASPYTVTLNGSAATFQSTVNASGGSGSFTIYNVSGVNTVVIQAATICGTTTNDTDNSITV